LLSFFSRGSISKLVEVVHLHSSTLKFRADLCPYLILGVGWDLCWNVWFGREERVGRGSGKQFPAFPAGFNPTTRKLEKESLDTSADSSLHNHREKDREMTPNGFAKLKELQCMQTM